MWSPSVRENIKRQMLSEEQERKRHKQALTEAMEKVRKKEQVDMIIEQDNDLNNIHPQIYRKLIPTREELYSICLQLQKQIKNPRR